MIVTIDGPAGAGKSHVSRALAERLGFRFLDTGATYRAVTLAALRQNIDLSDSDALARLSDKVVIEFREQTVLLNGDDVTIDIRSPEVASAIHNVADNPRVRQNLVELQRRIAAGNDIVTEGRDQGTVAFPNAECKFYLTASPEERARRRWLDLRARGDEIPLAEVLAQQTERDRRDASRPIGALRRAEDAIEISTDDLTPIEVVDQLEMLARQKLEQQ